MTSSSEPSETTQTVTPMDSSTDVVMANVEENPVNSVDEGSSTTQNTSGKRKRSIKPPSEVTESISNGRPKRTLSKREEAPAAMVNGAATAKTSKAKTERTSTDVIDGQERDKDIPVAHDVADIVWVKVGGHPWWPSIVIRDPNDLHTSFTKIVGNARPKRIYFVVFYGATADFAWVSDSAIIPYNGVEAFTKYAQEAVDKAQIKSQKEQLTERFQLKVTISRREDWETAVREADEAMKQTNDKRLQIIEPKVEAYAKKSAKKSQSGRRSKASVAKTDESSETTKTSTTDPMNRSLLAEKTFEFKSEDEDTSTDAPLRKPSSVKIKLSKKTSNDSDKSPTPPKHRAIAKTVAPDDKQISSSVTTVFGQTANGSSVSYEQRTSTANSMETTPVRSDSSSLANGASPGKKRARPQTEEPTNSDDKSVPEFTSGSPAVTTKFTTQRKPIVKPQAFMNSSTMNNSQSEQHDIRSGFLSSCEEQEVLDALEQLGSRTFEEAEQRAKRRYEHILCLNLNRTHVDIPQEWFYTFLFTHPSLIIKNPQWFTEKNNADSLNDSNLLSDVQSSSGLAVLKHQLVVLSKLYRNELQVRESASVKKRRSAGGSMGKRKSVEAKKQNSNEKLDDEQVEEELVN